MDGSGELFAPLVAVIGKQAKLGIVQYPPTIALDYAALTDFAFAQLPSSPCMLIAESFSGPIAIALAARFPERITQVVLSCSFLRNPLPWLSFAAPMLDFLPVFQQPQWWLVKQLFNDHATPELEACLQRASAQLTPEVIRARLKAVLKVDVREAARLMRQPLLYLRAAQDRVVPSTSAREIALARADAKILTLDGPHCLLQTAPRAAWQAIRAGFS
jgi:pimeloyl-ACP methyl ester carboxylesterase